MQSQSFKILADLLKQQSGLVVTADKSTLLETRLAAVAKKWNAPSIDALAAAIYQKHNTLQINDVVEAMTTNESLFFRDMKPFDLFTQTMLPALKQARNNRKLRIWSAACSSGQEAYSLAMLLKDRELELAGWSIEIVGTDISHEMVNRANTGLFSHFEVQRGLPARYLIKYFHQQQGDHWQINDNIRHMVKFKPWNLLHNLAALGQFDIVFCRNVLIYFDQSTKAKALAAIANQMLSDGYLVLGAAETVLGLTTTFTPVSNHAGLYALNNTAAPARRAASRQ